MKAHNSQPPNRLQGPDREGEDKPMTHGTTPDIVVITCWGHIGTAAEMCI